MDIGFDAGLVVGLAPVLVLVDVAAVGVGAAVADAYERDESGPDQRTVRGVAKRSAERAVCRDPATVASCDT